MDIKHAKAFARITYPSGESKLVSNGGIALTLREVIMTLGDSNKRFSQPIIIELSPRPITDPAPDDNLRFGQTFGIDPTSILAEDDLPESVRHSLSLAREVEADQMLKEYRSMMITTTREATPPDRQMELRRYVESKYAGTPHWDGIHRW